LLFEYSTLWHTIIIQPNPIPGRYQNCHLIDHSTSTKLLPPTFRPSTLIPPSINNPINLILNRRPLLTINNAPPPSYPKRFFDPFQTWITGLELRRSEPLMVSKLRSLRVFSPVEHFARRFVVLQHAGVLDGNIVPVGSASLGAHVEVGNGGCWVELAVYQADQ